MFRIKGDILDIEAIKGFIAQHQLDAERYNILHGYYIGRHKITEEEQNPKKQTDYRIINPYPRYITDILTGYFIGQPVTYNAIDNESTEDELLLEKLVDIFRHNNEQEENAELAKTASIKGCAYELMWTDEEARVRFKIIQPDEIFFVYGYELNDPIKYAVRYYQRTEEKKPVTYIEVYGSESVRYYSNISGDYRLEDEKAHYFGEVPVVKYENNSECRGDFEPVLTLIDAYDRSQSNTLNDMAQFTDAILLITGAFGTTDKDLEDINRRRTMLLDDDGRAEWLVKNVNDSWVENFKQRIKRDIHKFSFTPDLTDENFAGNSSGVALKYKLMGMEELRSTKERKFKESLLKRIRLICNFLKITNDSLIYTGISIKFENSLPQNILETTQIINNLSAYLSKETLIELLPFIENADEEIAKKESEEKEAYTDYGQLAQLLNQKGRNDE